MTLGLILMNNKIFEYIIRTNKIFKYLMRSFRKLELYFKETHDFYLKDSKKEELRDQAM